MRHAAWILLTNLLFWGNLQAQVKLFSPDGQLEAVFAIRRHLEPYPAGDRFYYSVSLAGHTVIQDSPFRLDFKGMPPFAENLRLSEMGRRAEDQSWRPVWGTHAEVRDTYREVTLQLEETTGLARRIQIIARAYDDGFAFRYRIPEQPGFGDFQLEKEWSEFHFPGDPTVWAVNYESFATHQESEFVQRKLRGVIPGEIIGCPLLVELPGTWVALTEAELTDWAGLYWEAVPAGGGVVSSLSPRIDDPTVKVVSKAPRQSPWRVVMIGRTPGSLIESNLILNLNPPGALEDTSWIEPGVSAWDRWWPGSYAPDFDGRLGMDTASMRYFVDFAAEMGWEYQLVDWTWYGPPFDPEKPLGAAGNPEADLGRSIPELDMPELVEYAGNRGVKILVWLDWFNAEEQMERVFPLYESWGVAGIKVDFMARDDQEMVNFYHRLTRLAARHHLVVDFHGAYKPTGMRRTYPNLLTREGVLGNEYNKWSDRITPTHNVTIPFTRMLCGPMDFTPGGFRHKTVDSFRIVGGDAPGPFVMGTRCHQLAMMVVYESPLQVMTDSPYSYRMSPNGLDFLKKVPTTWDDSRVLDGYPGQFIVMARKNGNEWYLGGMNGETPRAVLFPWESLGIQPARLEIWRDAEEVADYPEHLFHEIRNLAAGQVLEVQMASGGGFVAVLTPE